MASPAGRRAIALIAHDGKKAAMVSFVKDFEAQLQPHRLITTGTTGKLIAESTSLRVERKLSGPLGGDAQIAALAATGKIDAVIFFRDPLGMHPHDPDISMLMRICDVHNVPLATNPATATAVITQLSREAGIL
ncbi:MAG: methylglyoxal synthase [Candidatus Dadabacteria bacterium]|nr:MAG: methylglyoxal synthase [Candidatus Dadabacteria bacterium]